jgi:LDH2 family malate/lactate/ureidoglycolate dehydrogenase
MAPWGGAEARIGNNPIALGAPGGGAPHMILDIAMSQAAKSKIRAAAAKGEAIPEGWAADSQGQPTSDPAAALAGFLLPIGGHKGSGLALAVDILCGVLTGSGFLTDLVSGTDSPDQQSNLGHFFLALDPTRLIGREAYEDSMARFHGIVAGTPPAEGVTAVTLPGERMQARRRRALEEGVTLPRDLHEGLLALAG